MSGETHARKQMEEWIRGEAERIARASAELLAPRQIQADPPTMGHIRGRVQAAAQLVNELANVELRVVSYDTLQELHIEMSKLANGLQALSALPPGSRNEDHEKHVMLAAEGVCRFALPLVAYFANKDRTALATLEKEIRTHRDLSLEAVSSIQARANEVHEMSVRAAAAVEAAQKSALAGGISAQATEFKALSEEHGTAANRWFAGMIAVSASTIAVLVWLVRGAPIDDARPGVIVQFVLTRAVVFAAMSFVAVWASRSYRANRHLAVLNQHRHKALLTFEGFAAAAKDDATKNAVLLEATRCIFNAGSTGYTSAEADPSPAQFIEIVKTFAGKP